MIYAPVKGEAPTREGRQDWLRQAILQALPLDDAARDLVVKVTPHSFRAGLAGDLYRDGVATPQIQSVCRWNSVRVVRLYAERPALLMSRSTTGFRLAFDC